MLHRLIPYKYKKWSTLVGGVLIHLALGSFYTFGNMSPYLTSYLREYDGIDVRYSQSIWIYTALGISLSSSTIICGILNSNLGVNTRLLVFLGCVLMSAGNALTFFTIKSSFILTLLTYGVLNGIGSGFAYLGPLSIAMKWFPDYKGLANSAILFGYGGGSIIFDQIQTIYINPENYSPDKPYSDKFPDEKYFSKLHIELLERIPKVFLILGSIYITLQMIGFSLICEFYPKPIDTNFSDTEQIINRESEDSLSISENDVPINSNPDEINSLGVAYKSANSGLTLKETLRTPFFYILTLIMTTSTIGPGLVVTYYKTFGQTFISNDKFLAVVGSVSNIFNASGRLFWGYLIDKLPFKICALILNTCLISLIGTLYLTKFIAIKEIYLCWVSGILFCQCGFFVVMPTATAKCFGQKNFTAIYGLIFLLGIPSSFINAELGSHSDSIGWFWFFIIGCGFSLIGWTLSFFFRVKKSNGRDI